MSASKRRLRWNAVPQDVRRAVEDLLDGQVVDARSCAGGFSPGLASRLRLADGRRFFVKAINADQWPFEVAAYRDEAHVAAALPADIPVPRMIGTIDDGHWVALAFEHIDGTEPAQPWTIPELRRVLARLTSLSQMLTPSPIALPHEHPRLGGWAEVAADPELLRLLPEQSRWAADNLPLLVSAEQEGHQFAYGESLVHFDLFPHNVLLTDDQVRFVDWPHARLGSPIIDLVILLSSVAADGIDPDPFLQEHPIAAGLSPRAIDGVIAAHAGAFLGSALHPASPGLEPIVQTKRAIGLATLTWLQQRLTQRG
ncbi:phosphotransferase enzyme family protein [Sphaerisporangium viridialbum]|uniref:phosphotransferase enzyme family protein n=1 Tax=Sphaerisporangium viridialbum TaxID=46189 RepID=UPI003C72EBA1